jgi:hypothetical protein
MQHYRQYFKKMKARMIRAERTADCLSARVAFLLRLFLMVE